MESQKFVGPFVSQFIFYERIEAAAPETRRAMARVALNVSGEGADFPILLSDAISGLGWDQFQTVLGLLALRPHFQLQWNEIQLARLRKWAC